MTRHDEMVAVLADHEASGPLLRFLGKTRADLEAMSEDELIDLMAPAAQFQREAADRHLREAESLRKYRARRRMRVIK